MMRGFQFIMSGVFILTMFVSFLELAQADRFLRQPRQAGTQSIDEDLLLLSEQDMQKLKSTSSALKKVLSDISNLDGLPSGNKPKLHANSGRDLAAMFESIEINVAGGTGPDFAKHSSFVTNRLGIQGMVNEALSLVPQTKPSILSQRKSTRRLYNNQRYLQSSTTFDCVALISCAKQMTAYDFAYFFGKDYIARNASTSFEDIESDAVLNFAAKLENITKAAQDGNCVSLLEEFHGACIECVCDSVHETQYFNFTEIDDLLLDIEDSNTSNATIDSDDVACPTPGSLACIAFIDCAEILHGDYGSLNEAFPFSSNGNFTSFPTSYKRDRHGLVEYNDSYPVIQDYTSVQGCGSDYLFACEASRELLFGFEVSVGSICEVASRGADGMPGTCCMDKSTDLDDWGQKLKCSSTFNQACKKPGPWYSHVNEAACKQVDGTWCARPCSELKSCFSEADKATVPNDLRLEDEYSVEECQAVRDFYGYSNTEERVCDSSVRIITRDSFHDDAICDDILQASRADDFMEISLDSLAAEAENETVCNEIESADVVLIDPATGEILQDGTSDYEKTFRPIVISLIALKGAVLVAETLQEVTTFPGTGKGALVTILAEQALEATKAEIENFDAAVVDIWARTTYNNLITAMCRLNDIGNCLNMLSCPYDCTGLVDTQSGQFTRLLRGQGCDGVDQDCNGIVDECDEDQVPPEIVLDPLYLSEGTMFRNNDEAKAFLHENVVVTDDCATDFASSVAYDGGSCDESTFTFEAVDNRCVGPSNGTHSVEKKFVLPVDGTPPNVTCGFTVPQDKYHLLGGLDPLDFSPPYPAPAPGEPLHISPFYYQHQHDSRSHSRYGGKTSKSDSYHHHTPGLVDIGFFYEVKDNCPGSISVGLTIESNERQGFPPYNSMFVTAETIDRNGNESPKIFLSPNSCPRHHKPHYSSKSRRSYDGYQHDSIHEYPHDYHHHHYHSKSDHYHDYDGYHHDDIHEHYYSKGDNYHDRNHHHCPHESCIADRETETRFYDLTVTATDKHGNKGSATCRVIVVPPYHNPAQPKTSKSQYSSKSMMDHEEQFKHVDPNDLIEDISESTQRFKLADLVFSRKT